MGKKIITASRVQLMIAKNFSARLAWYNIISKVFDRTGLQELSKYYFDKKHGEIITQLESLLDLNKIKQQVIDDRKKNLTDIVKDNPIWVFWMQGMERAPGVVRACVDSIVKHANGRRVMILDETNWYSYVKIPNWFLELINNGTVSLTFFSDVLRMKLLSEYGGTWIDATVFLTKPLPEFIGQSKFFTIHNKVDSSDPWRYKSLSHRRWATYFFSGQAGYELFSFCYYFFLQYFSKQTQMIDYYLVDYAIEIFFRTYPQYLEDLNAVPVTNEQQDTLIDRLSHPITDSEFKKIMVDSTFAYKLSYKSIDESVIAQKGTLFDCLQRSIK